MSWRVDPHATRAAAEVVTPHRPVVRRNGRQYVIDSSAYGKIELIPLPPGRFLVAAESPPQPLPAVEHARLGRDLIGHLQRNRLRPWKIVPGRDVAEALRRLFRNGSLGDTDPELLAWVPCACKLAQRGKLIGQARLLVAERLAAMISAQMEDAPLPALVGPTGVGKRTTLSTAAEMHKLSAVELPLRRILTDRVLETPMECFLDTVLVAAGHMAEGDLLAVSDARLIATLPREMPRHVLTELARLPNVVLLAGSDGWAPQRMPGVVPIACPGLSDPDEARQLIRAHHEELAFAGPALSMICRAASRPAVGIVPGRLLYLACLAKALTAVSDGPADQPLSPDEVAPVIRIAQKAWAARDSDG